MASIINYILGWLFLGAGIASLFGVNVEPSTTHFLALCVLAKLCWIHSDMKTQHEFSEAANNAQKSHEDN